MLQHSNTSKDVTEMSTKKKHFILYKIYSENCLLYLGRTKQPLNRRLHNHFFKAPMVRAINIEAVKKIEFVEFETEADMNVMEKLEILTDAAKYDAACTSSGLDRTARRGCRPGRQGNHLPYDQFRHFDTSFSSWSYYSTRKKRICPPNYAWIAKKFTISHITA